MRFFIILFLLSILIGCAISEPKNISSRNKYEMDHNWCMDYSVSQKVSKYGITHTQTYKECMHQFGYTF